MGRNIGLITSVQRRVTKKVCGVEKFFFSSRRRHTRLVSDWSSDVCSSDLTAGGVLVLTGGGDALVLTAGSGALVLTAGGGALVDRKSVV